MRADILTKPVNPGEKFGPKQRLLLTGTTSPQGTPSPHARQPTTFPLTHPPVHPLAELRGGANEESIVHDSDDDS